MRRGRIFAFPSSGHPYVECLYAALRGRGVEVIEGDWSGRRLLATARAGDALHFHWPSFHYFDPRSTLVTAVGLVRFVVVTTLLKRRGCRVVWTAHNLYPHDGGKNRWCHRAARRYVVRIADEIFVHGRQAAEIVAAEFEVAREKLTVIPFGHWIGVYPNTVDRAVARGQFGIHDAMFVFVFLGLCKPYKGLEQLIDAIASDRGGSLLLIGGEFQSQAYHETIKSRADAVGAARVVLHAGFVPNDRIQVFLNAADAVVLPYREILTSGAAMLAMSFGRPVVAPRLGALVDFVGDDCGILYDPTESGALASALATARSRRFDSAAIVRNVSRFTWDDAARLVEAGALPTRVAPKRDPPEARPGCSPPAVRATPQ